MKTERNIVAATTLGCKVNMYDTEAIMEQFINKGYIVADFEDFADIYIINTCTVTNLGDRKSRQMIRRAKRKNPEACIVVAGCYAQISPKEVESIEGVNIVVGTKERADIVSLVENCEYGIQNKVSDIMDEIYFEELKVQNLKDRTRAFLKVQEGCDNFCTYCIIPFARGRVRSRQLGDVLHEANVFAKNGYKEIVLAGIHVASYGKDLGSINLNELILQIHRIEGIERIRLSSIEPNVVTDEFLDLFRSSHKLCDHLHLSLQSGCNKTLKNMNRRYTAEMYEDAVNRLRDIKPDISITTDIIVGFPGETDTDFNESLEFCKKISFANMHVFPYSAKEGTAAAKFDDQIAHEQKENRSRKMIELSKLLNREYMKKFQGREVSVLFERKIDENIYQGHTTNYVPVHMESHESLENKIILLKIDKAFDSYLMAK